MSKSGLYVLTLNNTTPMPIDLDPRRVARCIKVMAGNCKIGKARNLDRRLRNYESIFGVENVNFFPLAELDDIKSAEQAVLHRISDNRIRGSSGRPHEWLDGISAVDVARIVFSTLDDGRLAYRWIGSVS